MRKINKQNGISVIGWIIIIFILLIIFGYYGISVRKVIEGETSQENIGYVTGGIKDVWDKHLSAPFKYFWEEIWIKLFWESFLVNMQRIKDGQATDIQKAAPIPPGPPLVPK